MILVAYRHGLRAAELVALQWHAIDFNRAEIHVARVKGSASSTHPLTGRELRMLRRRQREQDPKSSFCAKLSSLGLCAESADGRKTARSSGIEVDGRRTV